MVPPPAAWARRASTCERSWRCDLAVRAGGSGCIRDRQPSNEEREGSQPAAAAAPRAEKVPLAPHGRERALHVYVG